MENEQRLEGTIERLAFGGEGIVKHNNLVVFVPYTAIGDRILYQITKKKKNFAQGELIRILEPGAGRMFPKCPYYGTCGGCQIQHLDERSQLLYKQNAVVDALERVGKIKLKMLPEVVPGIPSWAYRRHITLGLRALKNGFESGYTTSEGFSILPIRECAIFLPPKHHLFEELKTVLAQLDSSPEETGRLTILKDGSDFLFRFRFDRLPKNAREVFENALATHPSWKGVFASSSQDTIRLGSQTTSITIEQLVFTFGMDMFIQNHPEQSLNIYRDIIQKVASPSDRKEKIFDLYCGIGISSLLLALQGHDVFGVEVNPQAIAMAKENAKKNNLHSVNFLTADVKKGLGKWLKEKKPDLVILNPPRGGLDKEVVEALDKNPPKRLIYISCMPPTLARDIHLMSSSFEIADCRVYDMFPQTSHLETLVKMHRKEF